MRPYTFLVVSLVVSLHVSLHVSLYVLYTQASELIEDATSALVRVKLYKSHDTS